MARVANFSRLQVFVPAASAFLKKKIKLLLKYVVLITAVLCL